jgi:hypothetical protein
MKQLHDDPLDYSFELSAEPVGERKQKIMTKGLSEFEREAIAGDLFIAII